MPQSVKPGWCSQPPRVGEIVTCLFPNDPKQRLRPALVLETLSAGQGDFSVRVAYGTKQLDLATRGQIDLIVDKQEDVDACGLAVPTRFDLETTAEIPWEPPFSGCWSGFNSPVIGKLSINQQVDCAYKLQAIQNKP